MSQDEKLVVDEMLTRPSAVSPTLFVGLGGCGCQMVTRVAHHLRQRTDFAERYEDLVKFALVDTNINDLENYRELADESFLISDFEKESYANLASGKLFLEADEYFTQWVPQDYRFRAGDTAGAGQIRIESRLGSYYQQKHGNLVPRFRRLLEELKSHEHGHRRLDSAEIRIVMCYSVAGGTGSGSFLPLAYTLRDQASALGNPNMIGVCVLPAVFEDLTGANKDGTFANSYAALKEVEHLMKLGSPESAFFPTDGIEFHYDPSDESKTTVNQRPFDFMYLIDKPERFTVSNPVDAAADGLYLQLFGPLFSEQAGDYDNYTQHQRFLVPHDFEAKGIVGFTSFYGSYGAAVLLVPTEGLVDYCSRAASLEVMRQSFLGAIPGDPVYSSLRRHSDPFYEVTERDDDEEARPIHLSDFSSREEGIQDRLRDRLFQKRVRLLSRCEFDEGEPGRFMSIFRHGHRLGEYPIENAGVRFDKDRISDDQEQLADRGMNFSLGAVLLSALCGRRPGQKPGLLMAADRVVQTESERIESQAVPDGRDTVRDWIGRATRWFDRLKRRGIRLLDEGYSQQGTTFPGMEDLLDLRFLSDDSQQVSLAAKRYAILNLRDELRSANESVPRSSPFEIDDMDDDDRVRERDAPELIRRLLDQAIDRARVEIQREFIERRGELRDSLGETARIMRTLDENFDQFARDQQRRLERLRRQGDDSANKYVLDAEALRIENGRRMWDYFYHDRIASLDELSMSNPAIQSKLSGTVRTLSLRGGGSTTATLTELYDSLREYSTRFLNIRLGGDPRAQETARRNGLTLADALEMEVVYRALFMSNLEDVQNGGDDAIREILAIYNARPEEEKLDLTEPIHQDYLRDKFQRVVDERAELLVSYDESRDQHGGVRPCEVFLAAIDASFRDTTVETALEGASLSGLKWVKEGWNDPQKIVFYRAVLNVPLYVFGRMEEMKDYYYRFKNMSQRSKVLHIDQNWEESLPDLDPDDAQEQHRRETMRAHIVNFAALWTIKAQNDRGFIVLRDGQYLLRDPNAPGVLDAAGLGADTGDDNHLTALGSSLAEAIEELPKVLDEERVKYRPYHQLLSAVREGMAPSVLDRVVRLPFQWRRNRDELRTQYGSSPTPVQELKLRDFTEGFRRLCEALEGLLNRLRNIETERLTLGGDSSKNAAGLDPEQATRNLRQSVEILRRFEESWRALEDPESSTSVPPSFRSLFRPLEESELQATLDELRHGAVNQSSRTTSRTTTAATTATDDETSS